MQQAGSTIRKHTPSILDRNCANWTICIGKATIVAVSHLLADQ